MPNNRRLIKAVLMVFGLVLAVKGRKYKRPANLSQHPYGPLLAPVRLNWRCWAQCDNDELCLNLCFTGL